MLSRALSAYYPNGVEVPRVTIAVDASGKATRVTADVAPPLRPSIEAWGRSVRFAPSQSACTPAPIDVEDVDFFPVSNGVVGTPRVVDGIDFDNRTYSGGPGNCMQFTLENGTASAAPSSDASYDAYVQDLFAGDVTGAKVVVAVLRCEYNGHGFDSLAQVFEIRDGSAHVLGKIGEGGMVGPDSPLPPWPGGWIHVAFREGLLYADVWDSGRQCDARSDWTSTSYAVRGGKLVALSSTRHHRSGLQLACER